MHQDTCCIVICCPVLGRNEYIISQRMTKPTKWQVRTAKTRIILDIRPVWSESSLSAWRKLVSLATYWTHSEDSDQNGRIPRMICLRMAHMPFCWFCHALALIMVVVVKCGGVRNVFWNTCSQKNNSDHPGHLHSLITRISTGWTLDSQGCKVISCGHPRLWSDCAYSKTDLSLRWAQSEGTFARVMIFVVLWQTIYWASKGL